MPEREFIIEVAVLVRIRTRYVTARGQVHDFVVQLETSLDCEETYFPVVRYDASHGRPHRDVLNRAGDTVRKDWLPEHMNFNQALTFASVDIRINWATYLEQFLERK